MAASFWVLKILTTGFGEAASDALLRAFGAVAVGLTAVALVASFVAQFRVSRNVPVIYWLAVAMVGVFGALTADSSTGPRWWPPSRWAPRSAT